MAKKLVTAAQLIKALQKLPADAVIATLDNDGMSDHVVPIINLKRHSDFDEEAGGKAYTLEISGRWEGRWGTFAKEE